MKNFFRKLFKGYLKNNVADIWPGHKWFMDNTSLSKDQGICG